MSDMIITNAGLTAIASARTNGPMVDIVKFAVGSAFNYVPDAAADTSLRGTQLYPIGSNPAPPSNYYLTSNPDGSTVANYSLILDDSIGDFSYGEVGIFLPNGTLFALRSLSYMQPKIQSTPSTAGNTIEMLVRLSLGTDTPIISFETITGTTSTLAELATFDLAVPPSAADANVYRIQALDEYGRAPHLAAAENSKWYSPQYDMKLGSFVAQASGSSHYNVASLGALQDISYNVVPGRYLIRFTSGPLAGRVRNIVPVPAFETTKVYVAEQIVRPVTANGRIYRVTTAGTSGSAQPTWPTTTNGTVTSGSVTFTEFGFDNDHAFVWQGSLGTAVPAGTTFDVYRASSFTDFNRYITEYRLNSQARSHFAWHH